MEAREETFRRLYAAHFDAVLGYALRRTDRPEDAADVVSETFVVAWRRIGHVPLDGSLPWLYAVARPATSPPSAAPDGPRPVRWRRSARRPRSTGSSSPIAA